jgi:hypothetical protein
MARYILSTLKGYQLPDWCQFKHSRRGIPHRYCHKCHNLKTLCHCSALSKRLAATKRRKKTVEWKSEPAVRLFVLGMYGQKCLNCSGTSQLCLSHIVPRSWNKDRASWDYLDNFQPLCLECNWKKSFKFAVDYRIWLDIPSIKNPKSPNLHLRDWAFSLNFARTYENLRLSKI